MIDHRDGRVALLPPGPGQRQLVIDRPAWVAVAEVLVRPLTRDRRYPVVPIVFIHSGACSRKRSIFGYDLRHDLAPAQPVHALSGLAARLLAVRGAADGSAGRAARLGRDGDQPDRPAAPARALMPHSYRPLAIPMMERRSGVPVHHPRFTLLPGLSGRINPR
jgi:hypothetical protein